VTWDWASFAFGGGAWSLIGWLILSWESHQLKKEKLWLEEQWTQARAIQIKRERAEA
jgi:hypothetical protein